MLEKNKMNEWNGVAIDEQTKVQFRKDAINGLKNKENRIHFWTTGDTMVLGIRNGYDSIVSYEIYEMKIIKHGRFYKGEENSWK